MTLLPIVHLIGIHAFRCTREERAGRAAHRHIVVDRVLQGLRTSRFQSVIRLIAAWRKITTPGGRSTDRQILRTIIT